MTLNQCFNCFTNKFYKFLQYHTSERYMYTEMEAYKNIDLKISFRIDELINKLMRFSKNIQDYYELSWIVLMLYHTKQLELYKNFYERLIRFLNHLEKLNSTQLEEEIFDFRLGIAALISLHLVVLDRNNKHQNLVRNILKLLEEFNFYADSSGIPLGEAYAWYVVLKLQLWKDLHQNIDKIIENMTESFNARGLLYIAFALKYAHEVLKIKNEIENKILKKLDEIKGILQLPLCKKSIDSLMSNLDFETIALYTYVICPDDVMTRKLVFKALNKVYNLLNPESEEYEYIYPSIVSKFISLLYLSGFKKRIVAVHEDEYRDVIRLRKMNRVVISKRDMTISFGILVSLGILLLNPYLSPYFLIIFLELIRLLQANEIIIMLLTKLLNIIGLENFVYIMRCLVYVIISSSLFWSLIKYGELPISKEKLLEYRNILKKAIIRKIKERLGIES